MDKWPSFDWRENPLNNSPKGGGDPDFDNSEETGSWNFDKVLEKSPQFKAFIGDLSGHEAWLDLGSGLGTALVGYLVKQGKINPENLTSIDLDPANIEYMERNGIGGRKINADAANIPLEDGSFDCLITNMMLADNPVNQKTKKEDIVKEVSRVVKDGGVLITDGLDEFAGPDFELQFRIVGRGVLSFFKKLGIKNAATNQ
jgi:SAM-dependent methyltransferase